MNYLYRFLMVSICLSWLPAQAQNWRPFRPNGDVHAFRGASADTVLTLRLDSAGVNGSDSVYYFNRILRRAGSFGWQKAQNNQFGQQLRYNAAQRVYTLYWNGGVVNGFSLDYALVLKPFARVGDNWTSINVDVAVATTLVSRGTTLIDGVQDSVATFRVGNLPGVQVVLSKSYGLVSAPKDLRIYAPNAPMLALARRPAPAGLSYYNPLTLLDLQPGDELGYDYRQFSSSPITCASGPILRRVLMRQVTTDSIVYTLQQQSQTTYSGAPGCGPAPGTTVSPVRVIRLAASRRTGQWRGLDLLRPLSRPLLSYEYAATAGGTFVVLMAYPVVANQPWGVCGGPASLKLEALYQRSGTTGYGQGLDALFRQELSAQGVGVVSLPEHELVYTRRTVNGTVQTCGSRASFATLLPTKAAQRAATFQLYPNPATESATLRLAAPAQVGTALRLLDNLGRVVQRQQLAANQTTTTLSLLGLAPGVYVVEVQSAAEVAQHLPLQHQP